MKKTNTQLQETARMILDELTGWSWSAERDAPDEAAERELLEENDILGAVSLLRRYEAVGRVGVDRSVEAGLTPPGAPRTTRRDFLSQRLERRAARNAAETDAGAAAENAGLSGADAEDAVFVTDLRRDELTENGLPERLSEVYRRDARRYDGPFERY